ncbi:cytoplasmic tRNA 2-thiolation protein 2 isoform X2 [Hyla sarda]|uniref:cytoplasmic tRNA 2-thiolation protein 2 isoform X2 n=1 Tax=Hyla sarda TaxID=327740 RepID=UPI0024C229A2|nr:cytoplasmic tRNA 2-thiolation protein 2 isoform X2 [Hyla sarda]
MCEVGSNDYVELRKEEKSDRLGRTCMKCREGSAVLIIRVGDAFCKSCFKDYFVHKFRAILGKNRVVYPGEKVLLAYSGGPSSSAMIHQVQEGLGRDAPKKLRFIPSILFIDEGAVCGQSWEQREQNVSEICRVLQKTNFPFHIVPLEQVFTLPRSVLQSALPGNSEHALNYKQAVNSFLEQQRAHQQDELSVTAYELAQLCVTDTLANGSKYSCPPAELTTALMEIFNSARTLTAKLELLQCLRRHLILHVVRMFGYSKVMSGESCTRLAVRLLANISLGRGAFLPLDTGFSDDRYGDVVIVRPMREYSLKEISFYNRLFHVESVFIPTMETKAPENSSIQHLSEAFITKLQADFPSTVSTMYRTSEKLNISRAESAEENIQQEKCLLCMCNLDTHVGEASAFCATQVSQNLSQRLKNNVEATRDPVEQCCNSGQCSERSSSCSTRTQDLIPLLCYSCRVTVKDMTSVSTFPPYILNEAGHRSRRLEIRREIQEFLLDDGCGDM